MNLAAWLSLDSAWMHARQGAPQLILLTAEEGMGKTHLLTHWQRAQGVQAFLLRGHPWLSQLLRQYHGRFQAERDPGFVASARQLAPDLTWPLLAQSPNLQSDERLWLPVMGVLERLAVRQKGLSLLLDDAADWSREDWQAFLLLHRRFHAGRVPALLVLGLRPGMDLAALERQVALLQAPCQEVNLAPLDQAGVTELVREVTGDTPLPPELVPWLYRRTDGHPLHTQQLLQLLLAEGYLSELGVTWQFHRPEQHQLPHSLEQVLRQRLGSLTANESAAVSGLAVYGAPLSLPDWSELTHLDQATLREIASRCQYLRLVQLSGQGGQTRYSLQHAALRDLILARLSEGQRLDWHARSVPLSQGRWQAQHARAAGDARADDLTAKAMQQASQERQFSEVVELSVLLRRPQELPVDLRARLAYAQFMTGQPQRALELAADLDHPLARLTRYEAHLQLGAYQAALDEILTAEAHPQEDALTWRIREWLCLMYLGRSQDARDDLESRLPELGGLPRARALDALSDLLYDLGDLSGSLRVGAQAIEALREQQDWPTLSTALSNFGGTAGHFGRWQEGISALQEALALQEQQGYFAYSMYTHSNLGFLHLRAGHYRESGVHLAEAVRQASIRQDGRVLAAASRNLLEFMLRRGDIPGARRAYQQSAQCQVSETVTPPDEAELLVFEGQPEQALAALERGTGEARQLDPAPQVAFARLCGGQVAQALQVLQDAWSEEDHPSRRALFHYLKASTLHRSGQPGALAELREALRLAREDHHEPLTLELQLAEQAISPPRAVEQLEVIRQRLQELDASGHLLRLNLLLGRSQEAPNAPTLKTAPGHSHLLTLGTFACLDAAGKDTLRGKKPRALLATLLCAHLGSRPGVPRQQLLAELWPDADEDNAEQAFRTTLKRLRAGLNGTLSIRMQGGLYRLHELHSDVTCFLEALERRDYPSALGWYQGPFLPGVDLPGVEELRSHLHARYRHLTLHYHLEHPPELAAPLLETLLRDDPFDLEALEVLGTLLIKLGRRQRWQQLLERSQQVFLQEFGELPPEWASIRQLRETVYQDQP